MQGEMQGTVPALHSRRSAVVLATALRTTLALLLLGGCEPTQFEKVLLVDQLREGMSASEMMATLKVSAKDFRTLYAGETPPGVGSGRI
jgi:hypothetical protein